MKNCKKIIAVLLVLACVLSLCACGSKEPAAEAKATVKLKIGASTTPHAEILAACKPILAEQGIEIEIVEFSDYVQPNTAVEDGSLDANYFQHTPYMNTFNAENGTHLVSVGLVHYEPFGIYAGKAKSLAELPEGATIAIPNDGSNETRALLLLQQEGLIVLKSGIDASSNATVHDIAENPKNLNIVEMEAAQITKALPDVDLGVINGNYALQAGLNAGKDALAVEDASGSGAQTYANILCVKEGRQNEPAILAVYTVMTSEAISTFINEKYSGAVVPVH